MCYSIFCGSCPWWIGPITNQPIRTTMLISRLAPFGMKPEPHQRGWGAEWTTPLPRSSPLEPSWISFKATFFHRKTKPWWPWKGISEISGHCVFKLTSVWHCLPFSVSEVKKSKVAGFVCDVMKWSGKLYCCCFSFYYAVFYKLAIISWLFFCFEHSVSLCSLHPQVVVQLVTDSDCVLKFSKIEVMQRFF